MASTIAERLIILASAKADLASAIVEKGGTVPSTLSQYGDAIRGITTEVVSSCFIFTSASTTWPDCVVRFNAPSTCQVLQTSAFVGFPNLSGADLGFTVTEVGERAFFSCSRLQMVAGPVVQKICRNAFRRCSMLSLIGFPQCSSIGSFAFAECYQVDSSGYADGLDIISFPACLYIDQGAFGSCGGLTKAYFPEASYIGPAAFRNCSALSVVYASNVRVVDTAAFYEDNALSSVPFPLCETIGYNAFYGCALTALDFPKCTVIGSYAFRSCSVASRAAFPACQSIGSEAFAGCPSLRTVDFTGVSAVPILASGVFYPSSSVTIVVPSSLYSEWVAADNWSSVSSLISTSS